MDQIQIYHEAPLSIFEKVQAVTDGDYALVHLLDSNPTYAEKFAKRNGRATILDNSAYELGKSFNPEVFAGWVVTMRPDVYVVPDVPGNADETLAYFQTWKMMYPHLPGKKMGVIQGKSELEAINCFKQLKSLGADVIGVPFLIGRRFFEEKMSDFDLMSARIRLVARIHDECEECPIHLLGISLPQEGGYIRRYPWVVSVDTSNPIVHGLFRIGYNNAGLKEKRSELLANLIDSEVSEEQEVVIWHNIERFRTMWTRIQMVDGRFI